jgi:hypothetical protein
MWKRSSATVAWQEGQGSLQAQKEALLRFSYCASAVEEVTSQHGFFDQRLPNGTGKVPRMDKGKHQQDP